MVCVEELITWLALHAGADMRPYVFQPHEDGPAYHPVVATISLGSHTVFHYYAYEKEGEENPGLDPGNSNTPTGRIVNQKPVLSVLLEPRSLVVSTGEMYVSHLHG